MSGSDRVMVGQRSPGTLTAENSTLRNLIRAAYDVQVFQVIGGPTWVDRDRYDVTAKAHVTAQAPVGDEWPAMALMLRSLLEERFKLTLRRDTQTFPVYVLVAANGGAKLHHADGGCITSAAMGLPSSSGSAPTVYCGSSRMGGNNGIRTIDGAMITIAALARALSTATGREVVDRTGISETFDVHLEWTPDVAAPGPQPPPDPNGVSLFTTLGEQLGLRLQAEKAPVDVLVIDHVEKPQAD